MKTIALLGLVCIAATVASAENAPNFVVALGEGHGWSSTSVQMDPAVPESRSATVRTPNLERLAAEGMRFANFYAASPRCTPSRAALFTGKSPAQLHMTFVGEGRKEDVALNGRLVPPPASTELSTDETTIAELLKTAGYATAHFGKWHCGRVDPKQHGFDESDGPTNNGGPDNVDEPHPKQLFGMTTHGCDFMKRQVAAERPFYLQLSHYASRAGGADAETDIDVAFGNLLQRINELGIASNTFVLFTTDHGTPGRNPPFAGGKGTVSEGGLRVPFILRGPGIAKGSCSYVRAIGEDIFPTLAGLAGITSALPQGIEGGSLAAVLHAGGTGIVSRTRDEYVVHFPHYDKDATGPASALWLGEWKLVRVYESGARHLFDLVRDPAERNDLAQAQPERVRELDGRLTTYLEAVHAQMPTTNNAYDPTKPTTPKRGGKWRAAP